ncbi:hypothetical protein EXN65_14630 [Clostridium botulinum]|uniref:type II toxin-antitoxin system PemK/MazF family toxin n=1 Tax=Clostridium botulinum TaxID=1491 RepID=UPI0013F0A1B8|nr:type II toxin-antitoxin system PemK/MazF family toxin [Clostridium botulinum]NEZ85928.1 hypothetical protein [Clostridium botulinum]NFE31680.1 hypothetical protein [Clostridium botulinum]WCJ71944.1 type II toxin-antitoxin system PemK/MazF family toxin [Clostridium botulinum]WCJ75783.1 type II toxin-antitoxin system PemK/MazF family toxin [Clostridium botulinum]WCJ79622.1 type II toxin-antitoxin system PemK/MazF family toxin [Clostridium botulinum]
MAELQNEINNQNIIDKFRCGLLKKGDIFYTDLDKGIGSEVGRIKQVVVIQDDLANKYLGSIIIAPIIKKRDNRSIKNPMHIEVGKDRYSLNCNCIVLLEKMTSIDKKRLTQQTGTLSIKDMKNVDKGILIAHGLFRYDYQKKLNNFYDFKINQLIPYTEGYDIEFKEVRGDFKKLIKDTILKYCVSFLNTKGGSLYYGITDTRIVKGVKITLDQMDDIKKLINNSLYNITPHISLNYFEVNFISVKNENYSLIKNLYVVQIRVAKPNDKDIYFANDKDLFIRGNGVTKKLGGVEIVSYIRKKIKDEKGAN